MAKVTIYTTPTCHYCKMAKVFFQNNGIDYDELDVQADLKAREQMLQESGQMGVPVIKVDTEIVIGFDEEHLRELLKV